MPEYLAPGVYVEEVQSGPPPIQGVGTSTTGFVGVTRRGPHEGRPLLVTSYGEFVRTFGGPFDFGNAFAGYHDLPHAVRGFFANGGRRLYVGRVAPSGATPATGLLRGGLVTHLVRDVLPNGTVLALPTLRGVAVGTVLRLRMRKNGIVTETANLNVTALDRGTGEVTVNAAPSTTLTYEARFTTVLTNLDGVAASGQVTTLASPVTAKPASFGLRAATPGSWGRDLRVEAAHRSAATAVVDHTAVNGTNTLVLSSARGFYVGAWVEVDFGNTPARRLYRQVTAVDGVTVTVGGAAFAASSLDPQAPVTETRISTCEFDLTLTYEDPVERTLTTERYTGLTLANVPGRFYVDALAGSQLAHADPAAAPASTDPLRFPSPGDGFADTLPAGGSDGAAAPTPANFAGQDLGPDRRTGLLSMEDVDEVAILAAPGVSDVAVQRAVIDQCERLMDRFAVLDPPGTTAPASLAQIQAHAANFDTKYAAIYYPKVIVADPVTGQRRAVAPSGHVAGMYARVDNTRGVHKAPANEVLNGIIDLEVVVSRGQQEILNPLGINVIRDLRADRRGLRVFGARCLTSDQTWRYVNVRRLFIYLEESLSEGTQWAVFEPNDHRLWARIRDSVAIFLTGAWRDGALMGAKPDEGFFVICDRNVMSDDDILNGRLVMEIGIAPVRPAEFVILRIGQWLGGSATQEL